MSSHVTAASNGLIVLVFCFGDCAENPTEVLNKWTSPGRTQKKFPDKLIENCNAPVSDYPSGRLWDDGPDCRFLVSDTVSKDED